MSFVSCFPVNIFKVWLIFRILKNTLVGYSHKAACVSTFVTECCEPRQARKGATVAVTLGTKGLLAQVVIDL
jgi:hypothetical protein